MGIVESQMITGKWLDPCNSGEGEMQHDAKNRNLGCQCYH